MNEPLPDQKFENWVKEVDARYSLETYTGGGGIGYVQEEIDLAWMAWQAALSQQPTLEPADMLLHRNGMRTEPLRHPTERSGKKPEAAIEDRADAERYRWLRDHFRWANDSMQELWFDASIGWSPDGEPEELDRAIDARSGEKREVGKPESL